jgi:predicted RNA-binding protein YlxR (DUF448 family)
MPAQPQAQEVDPILDQELDAGLRPAVTERLCVATGVVRPVGEMIRFVLGPDSCPVPDLKRRLPGRGVWVTANREALAAAVARKAFARSFRREVRLPPDLVGQTERLLERAATDALAIARKAGKALAGFAKVEAALAEGRAVAVLHASEAAADGVRKLKQAGQKKPDGHRENIFVIAGLTSAQLDLAFGRANVIHAALLAGPESETFLARMLRLERFRAGRPEEGNSCGAPDGGPSSTGR